MIESQDTKIELLIRPTAATVATNATQKGYLDTLGWDYATIIAMTRAAYATTTAAFAKCSLSEGTNSAAATAITAFTGGTATSSSVGYVIAAADNSTEGAVIRFNVDLTKRERYLLLSLAPGVAGDVSALAILSRGRVVPGSDDGSVVNDVTG